MKGILLLIVILSSLGISVSSDKSSYFDCGTSLFTLEKALYETGINKLSLNQFFYEARKESVSYAKITYHFKNENGSTNSSYTDDCTVTYLWATGGFLFIQPPQVFTYTSLFFFHTQRKKFSLDLELPHDCISLVNVTKNGCSCANLDNNPLDLLSQQVF